MKLHSPPAIAVVAAAPLAFGQADVIVGDLTGDPNDHGVGPRLWGSTGDPLVSAYSFGTVSCNVGEVPLDWYGEQANHPVIAQNMYRIAEGRIVQVGMAWVKHGSCALQESLCGACEPFGSGCAPELGVGCSDPYSPERNGQQWGMGPRSEVDASSGTFEWPFSTKGEIGAVLWKRLQVPVAELAEGNETEATYVAEAIYLAADDQAAGNGANNASYRTLESAGLNDAASGYDLVWTGQTVREAPAIFAWQDHGLGQGNPDPAVHLVQIPTGSSEEGLMWLGWRVSNNLDGTWRYEYAIENVSFSRGIGSFTVPLSPGVAVSNAGFHDVDYHSGEPYDDTDWEIKILSGSVVFRTPEKYSENPDGNALRWGTLYSFWFDADAPPAAGLAGVSFFEPAGSGELEGMTVSIEIPGAAQCIADANGDGQVNVLDFVAFQTSFLDDELAADCDDDGSLTIADFVCFQGAFAAGCE